jgi:hypothetical protein
VSDVENHLAGFGKPAANLLIQRHEEAVHLEGYRTGASLALALAGSGLAEIGEISAAHLVSGELGELTYAAAVVDEDPKVHLGFAADFFDVAEELSLVGPDGFTEAIVVVEDGAESKRKNGGVFKAISDDSCVVHTGFLVQGFCRIVFADDNCEVTGWVKEDLVSAYSVY